MGDLIPDFLLAKEHLSRASLKEYERYIGDFDAWANHPTLGEILPPLVSQYIRDRKARSIYVARYAGAVMKTFSSWLAEAGYLRGEYGGSALASVKVPRVPREGRSPLEDSQHQIIEAIIARSPNRIRHRDSALYWLLLACGTRCGETLKLLLEDVHIQPRGSFIDLRWETTKGKRARRIRLDPKAASAIRTYVADWRPSYSGQGPEPLFLTEAGKPFKEGGWRSWMARLGDQFEKGGVPGWHPHLMRHKWATDYHSASKDTGNTFADLQREGGWLDDSTPRRYMKDRPWDELAAMPTSLSVILARRRSA